MKKLVTVFALCAAMSALAQVESANIVGYNTITLKPGFNMIGVQFQVVGGTAASDIAVDDFISKANLTAGGDYASGDNIYVFRNGDYLPMYYLWDNGSGGKEWYDVSDNPTDPLKNGDAMWYYSRAGADVTAVVAGQIGSGNTTVSIKAGAFNMLCNPFPVTINIDNMANWASITGAVAGGDYASGDNVYVFANGDYLPMYYLWDNGSGGKEWYDVSDNATVAFAPGQGFWYYSRAVSDFSITFTKPY